VAAGSGSQRASSIESGRRTGSRTYLTEEETVSLIKICVEKKTLFLDGLRDVFWGEVRRALLQEIGRPFLNVKQKMAALAKARRLEKELEETGGEYDHNERTNALDAWLDVLDVILERAVDKRKLTSQLELEMQES
jgi:hypothetical protein